MAEFVLAPSRLGDDDGGRALLLLAKELLAKEQANLKQKFDTLTQGILQIPYFVADRSQTFEHKQKRSGLDVHSHMKECMVKELELFLPSDLPRSEIKEYAEVQLGLNESVSTADAPKQAVTATSERAFPYLQYEKKPTSLQLEACFVFILPWDQSSLQVHYVFLNVHKREKSFWTRQETLEVEGKRSVMKFSMVRSTAEQVMSALKSKGKLVEDEAEKFYEKTNKYDSSSIGNAMKLPVSTASSAEEQERPLREAETKEFPSNGGDTHDNKSHEPTESLRMETSDVPTTTVASAGDMLEEEQLTKSVSRPNAITSDPRPPTEVSREEFPEREGNNQSQEPSKPETRQYSTNTQLHAESRNGN